MSIVFFFQHMLAVDLPWTEQARVNQAAAENWLASARKHGYAVLGSH
jgi:hypothetical protein